MDSQPAVHPETLSDFLKSLWHGRVAVMAGAVCGLGVGAVLLFSLLPHYEAHMIVGPSLVQDTGDAFASFEVGRAVDVRNFGAASQLPSEFVRFEQIVREATVATILSRYGGILEEISKDRMFKFQSAGKMQPADLADYLRRHVRIEPMGTTSSRRISYSHPDPSVAARILKHLHTITDETIRQKTGVETQERIAWLQKELGQSPNPDHRAALTTLLLAQERRRMLVAMDQPYAAEIIEAPASDARPAWPRSSLVLMLSILLGGAAGFVVFTLKAKPE